MPAGEPSGFGPTSDTEHVIVTTTVEGEDAADGLAEQLVATRLAACVQLSPVISHYQWQGEQKREAEVLLTIKTRADRAGGLIEAIGALHPYDEPEILVTPIIAGSPGYLRWIDDQVHRRE